MLAGQPSAKFAEGCNGVTCAKFAQVGNDKTRDKVAEAFGISGKTYEKAKASEVGSRAPMENSDVTQHALPDFDPPRLATVERGELR